jgi:hypothetical protein
MNIVDKYRPRKKYVRIMIGSAIEGESGMISPIRTITLEGTNFEDILSLIKKVLKEKSQVDENSLK